MASVTLQEIMMSVRELTFDRFIIPAFTLKQSADAAVKVDKDLLRITKSGSETLYEFTDYPTLYELTNKLLDDGVVLAFTPYFKNDEPSTSLMPRETDLTENVTLYRRYFFSDSSLIDEIKNYYLKVLDLPNVEVTDEIVAKLKRPSEKHMAIWVSYKLVERRRLYENAVTHVGETFSDGSNYTAGSGVTLPSSTTVNIGSVFSITEDVTQGYFYEDFNRVGSDNTWGDRYSFWYKLMLYLRGLIEEDFGDYSLRKDTVMGGRLNLVRDLDFRAYYDSYPFTLSPLSRGIVSKQS
jgi:hypothetical protein